MHRNHWFPAPQPGTFMSWYLNRYCSKPFYFDIQLILLCPAGWGRVNSWRLPSFSTTIYQQIFCDRVFSTDRLIMPLKNLPNSIAIFYSCILWKYLFLNPDESIMDIIYKRYCKTAAFHKHLIFVQLFAKFKCTRFSGGLKLPKTFYGLTIQGLAD